MTSSRLILIFLGFIFFIIVILSSNRISSALRSRFGNLIPSKPTVVGEMSLTPTITPVIKRLVPTPTIIYGGKTNSGTQTTKSIPATGPEDIVWLAISGSFFTGWVLKKIS